MWIRKIQTTAPVQLGKMKEACGVVAIASKNPAAESLYIALTALQHRGQEAAGIAIYNEDGTTETFKGMGLAEEAFRSVDLSSVAGTAGIGHDYYSIKISVPENAQPTLLHTSVGDIAIAHNGIITNAERLKEELLAQGHNFFYESEEESIAYLLADCLKERSIPKAVKTLMKTIEGSYSFTIMFNGRVFGIRDPLGIKPLCLGKLGDGYIIASESVAIDALGGTLIRDVMPGELVEITPEGYESHQLVKECHRAGCFFEFVYFARADSIIDGIDVYRARERLGEILAREHPVDADVVIPIPDSGRAHAYGYARASGIPMAEGLMKNRYIARTFILPSQKIRERFVQLKVNPVKSIVAGKRIVIVDDSIVRGTTMKKIVGLLRSAGATEVHVRIASPPIIAPCYYGIDMTTREQLIASDKEIDDICNVIGADSLRYISIQGLVEALGASKNDLCLGCVTGEYPVKVEGEKLRFQEQLETWEEQ